MTDTTLNVHPALTEAMIPIADIEVGKRLRDVKQAKVEEIAASIETLGLLQAITVSKHPSRPAVYILEAGKYRLEAHKHLKRTEIRANVTELTGDRLALVQTDENLMRADLDDMERADFIAARKEIYERLHPETKQHVSQGEGKKRSTVKSQVSATDRQIGSEILTEDVTKEPSYVQDTSEKMDRSETSIRRDLDRAKKICHEAKQKIKGTWIGKSKKDLDEIKELASDADQIERVEKLLMSGPPPSTKKPSSGNSGNTKPSGSGGKPMPKSSAPLEHHGDGNVTSQQQVLAKRLDPLFDALWLGLEPRENAAKIENVLAERNVIAVSDRKRDPKKHLRDLKEKAPKVKPPKIADAWGTLIQAWNATAGDAAKFVRARAQAKDTLLHWLVTIAAQTGMKPMTEVEQNVKAAVAEGLKDLLADIEKLKTKKEPEPTGGHAEGALNGTGEPGEHDAQAHQAPEHHPEEASA